MLEIFANFLPVLLLFAAGYTLKRAKILTADDGGVILKMIFYVGMPGFIFSTVMRANLSGEMIKLLLLPLVMVITLSMIVLLLRRNLLKKLPQQTFGAMLTGVLIMNTGFVLPFIERGFGADGLARLAVIDAANAIITVSIVYAIALSLGSGKADRKLIIRKILLAPPLWAFVLAMILRGLQVESPQFLTETSALAGRMVSPAILIAVGLKFMPELVFKKLVLVGAFLRFGLGLAIGVLFVLLFNLRSLDAIIVIICSTAPFGFNSILFADLAKLDSKYAAAQVSAGLIAGFILIPALIVLLPLIFG